MIWLLVDSSSIGGIERHVATLATALSRRGIGVEIVLLARHGDNPWLQQLTAEGLAFRVLDGTVSGLVSAMNAGRPQLVHTHGYKAGLLGRLTTRALRIPVVSTFHAGERAPFPVNLYQRLDEWTSLLGGRIAVSQPIADAMPWRTPVIRNFLAVSEIAPQAQLPRAIGFLGRMSHEKGPDLFCRIARESPADIAFHMWGDGPMRTELESAYADRVVFHGLVADTRSVWRTIGLLLMPSRAEGLPMAALEALAAGVPVAASRVGALPELIEAERNGWLFDVGDIAGGITAIRAWSKMTTASSAALRQACWQGAFDGYSENAVMPHVLRVYACAGWRPDQPARETQIISQSSA